MAARRIHIADYYDHHIFTFLHIRVPSGEKSGIPESYAPSDLIGGGHGLNQLFPVIWQQIGVPFGDMTLSFLRQLDFALQVRARHPAHHGSPCNRNTTMIIASCAGQVNGVTRENHQKWEQPMI